MSRTPTLPEETIEFAKSEWERVLTENEIDLDWYDFDDLMSYSNQAEDCEYEWFADEEAEAEPVGTEE